MKRVILMAGVAVLGLSMTAADASASYTTRGNTHMRSRQIVRKVTKDKAPFALTGSQTALRRGHKLITVHPRGRAGRLHRNR